jgi:multicomponent Na+:H+ antiporter subunit G
MSALVVDVILYVLLIIGVGFGGIGVLGLLIFPDIRSRMFTGIRATLISCGAIILAGIIYGLFALYTRGGAQYVTFTIHVILFFIILVILNWVAARAIVQKTTGFSQISAQKTVGSGNNSESPKNE